MSLAVGKNKEDEASCGISINGMYYVQSVTLDHPDFFTGTVEIQVGKDAQWGEETWGSITPLENSNIIGRVQFKHGTFTGDGMDAFEGTYENYTTKKQVNFSFKKAKADVEN